ncbi:eukaryotic translation initiation factor 4E-binding protein 1 [Biomphalaria glabrata]|uniref:Eukaryotic translation initiation factor 4E-binding protein 1-like n=2 Tax=Biomphalaria TaxID=6525 RepID=A0A182YTN4_BIOGL|nr:eukaryotic translation initiation factor 4E-binding protein 1-like [Biomphalaria glabrata]KAI8731608.1 eukaryotic translation initiation factor 4E-binding protein 1-like [Biomphalaria glabrata]KAI8796632.1 eukaryotic translation initiation factor 4E-binding protein 1 [Biomphalaria glabrata]KAK0056483.1 eukaryotic translation initiation factor 4E-binding protein 1 [Biomphalaria pfeifferi]
MASQEQSPKGRDIPAIRRVVLNDVSQLPSDYSSTPGGTLFSTTPGGTRIVYDRSRLMQLRNSPLARSPPANMAKIPGITDFNADALSPKLKDKENGLTEEKDHLKEDGKYGHDEHPQFEMDI